MKRMNSGNMAYEVCLMCVQKREVFLSYDTEGNIRGLDWSKKGEWAMLTVLGACYWTIGVCSLGKIMLAFM